MSSSNFVLAQLNANRSPSFINCLSSLREIKCSLLALTEPPTSAPFTDERYIYEKAPNGTSSFVSFAILNDNLKYQVTFLSPFIGQIQILDLNLTIYSIYIRPAHTQGDHGKEEPLQEMLKIISRHKSNTIITGDLNAHISSPFHPEDARASIINETIRTNSWILLNSEDEPTCHHPPNHQGTIVDWTIATPDLATKAIWYTTPCESRSDHALIITEIKSNRDLNPQTKTIIDFNSFKEQIQHLSSPLHLETAIEKLYSAISKSTRTINYKHKQPWYNNDCCNIKKEITKLKKRKTKASPDQLPRLLSELKSLSKKYKKIITKAKYSYETSIFNSNQADKHNFKYLKAINKRYEKKINFLLHEGETITDPTTIANLVIPYFFPASDNPPPISYNPTNTSPEPPIEPHEIKLAIAKQKPSAPGDDNINIHLISLIFRVKESFLTDLFNLWFKTKQLPKALKSASIIIIYKDPNKKPTLNNIRPIALTSFITRIFERVILNRVNHYLYHGKNHLPDQMAHRKNTSLEETLLPFYTFAIEHPRNYAILGLDVANAFNNVHHQAIIDGYNNLNIPNDLISTIQDLLEDRKISFRNQPSSTTTLKKGIYQGAILSPSNFNIAMGKPLEDLRSTLSSRIKYKLIGYSDDINIIFTGWTNLRDLENIIHLTISTLESSLSKQGLSIARNKLSFSANLGGITNFKIPWNNLNLENSKTVRILGVLFEPSSHNNFTANFHHRTTKAKAAIHKISSSLSSPLVPLPVKRRMIQSNVYSIFNLGASFTYLKPHQSTNFIKKCSQIDRLIAIKIFKLPKCTSTATTTAALYPSSLYNHIITTQDLYSIKTGTTKLSGNLSIDKKELRETYFHPAEKPTFTVFDSLKEAEENLSPNFFYFTDASQPSTTKNNFLTINAPNLGAAWLLLDHNKKSLYKFKQAIFQTASVTEAELYAIHLAIQNASRRNLTGKILIASDSKSSLLQIKNFTSTNQRVVLIHKLLRDLNERNCNIFFCHVKSHSGNKYNDRADKLAKEAVSLTQTMKSLPLSKQALRNFVTSKLEPLPDKVFSHVNGNHFKSIFPNLNSVHSFLKNFYFTRNNLKIFSGHGPFIWRLHNLKLLDSPLCLCGETDSLEHTITSCPFTAPLLIEEITASQLHLLLQKENYSWETILPSTELKTCIFLCADKIISILLPLIKNNFPDLPPVF